MTNLIEDGIVDETDLVFVLDEWGACPQLQSSKPL